MRRITLPTTAASNHAGSGSTFPSLLSPPPPPPPPPAATLLLLRLHGFHHHRDACHDWGIRAAAIGTRLLLRRLCWSSSPLPPPEWVNPFLDLSDLATAPPGGDRHHPANPSPWLARVLVLLCDSHAVDADLDAYCRRFLIRLSPAFVSHALRSPELRARPGTALRFFRWAARQRHYPQHQLESYVTLVDIFASSSRPLADHNPLVVRELVTELRELGFRLTPSACGSLIKSLGAAGMVEELLWVWRWMKESGVEPSVFTYNCLLCGLVNASFFDSAEKVFDVMRSDKNPSIDPDVVTYNIMIKGYCRAGKTKFAVEKLREMEVAANKESSSGCQGGGGGGRVTPDKITYTMLIQAHYADGDFDACLGLYHEMVERGLDVPTHAYTLVITGLCRAGKPFQALAVFNGMIDRGCRGNAPVYTALMDAFARTGNGERAMDLLEKMKRDGVEPDEVTYGVVVNCLCKSGRLEEALHWFRLCKDEGVAVNAVFYCSLIDGFGKAGMTEEATRLFEEMTVEGLVPDAFCYNALMDALCRAGRTDEALALWERMKQEGGGGGVDGTVHTYTILMQGLFREHRNEEAIRVWEGMVDAGIAPTAAAFRVLARGLCLSGKVGRACRVLDELGPMGVVPEGAHEEMIQVLCGAGRIEQACKLADGIVERGREIPGRVRTAFINALRKSGKPELAIKLVNSKIGIGYDRLGGIKRRVKFQTLLSWS